jgi:hypothetical protein
MTIDFSEFRLVDAVPVGDGRPRASMSPERIEADLRWIEREYRRRCAARQRAGAFMALHWLLWAAIIGVLIGAVGRILS